MEYIDTISLMKKSSFEDAFSARILVSDKEKNVVGYLVPVGEWILSDEPKIELIRRWRQRAMRMFLTQFESTLEKTLGYLKNLSIEQKGRIFFLLYDEADRFVGHMGIADVDGRKGELDNLMRGADGGHPRLVYFAEVAFLKWCFEALRLSESEVRILSYNWVVRSLHEEVGYKLARNIPLRKTLNNGVTLHEEASVGESNVKYSCIKMALDRDFFFKTNDWLT